MTFGVSILWLIAFGLFGIQIEAVAREARSAVPEAGVVMSERYRAGRSGGAKCGRPIEIEGQFKNCRADFKTDGGIFPASKAECDCESCYKSFTLRCKNDGKWYPEVPSYCELSNKAVQCGKCPVEGLPQELMCYKGQLGGYLREARSCKCKDSCKDVTIRCEESGVWNYMGKSNCNDVSGLSRYVSAQHLNISYHSSSRSYSYTCDTGYELQGENSSQCVEGVMKSTSHKCVELPEVAREERYSVPEAKVMMSIKYDGKSSGAKCGRPKETKQLFKNCRADEKEGGIFPASTAFCDCPNCYKNFTLRCKNDGKWYPEILRYCDVSNKAVQCGKCTIFKLPKELNCLQNKLGGYLNEIRNCTCKDSCKDVTIRCEHFKKSGTWNYLGRSTCTDVSGLSRYVSAQHLNISYHSDSRSYSYTCDNGFELQGENSSQCVKGVMKSAPPTCIKIPEASTEGTTTATPTATIAATAGPQTSQEAVPTTVSLKLLTSPSTPDPTPSSTLRFDPVTSTVDISTTETFKPTDTTTVASTPPEAPMFTTASTLETQPSARRDVTSSSTETTETSSQRSSSMEPSSTSAGPEPQTSTVRDDSQATTDYTSEPSASTVQRSTFADVSMTSPRHVDGGGTFPPSTSSDVTARTFQETDIFTKQSSEQSTLRPSTSTITSVEERKDDFTTSTPATVELTSKAESVSSSNIPITTTLLMLKTTTNIPQTHSEITTETTTSESEILTTSFDFGEKEIIPNLASFTDNTLLISSSLIGFIICTVLLCVITVKKRRASQNNEGDVHEKHNMAYYMDTLIRHPLKTINDETLDNSTEINLRTETDSFITNNVNGNCI